jgi:[acyl-carrier-protein] S-malonyltransferase
MINCGMGKMKTALLFSGQGSQYVGMMKDLYDLYPEAKELVDKADKILGFELSRICFEGPLDLLKETRYTQPALFLHSSLIMYIIGKKLEYSAVAGHSVGEYAALYSAGVLSFEDALKLVALRGELMFRAGESEPGTMFAIINLDDKKVEEVCNSLTDASKRLFVVPANFNSPGQIVISGSAEHIRNNIDKFKEAGARMVKELVVSGAFHSPLMEPAKKELEKAILGMEFRDAKVPVYVNVTASPVSDGKSLQKYLIEQLTSPVLWTQTLLNMKNDGILKYIEIGAGNVLQGLVKRTLNDIEIEGIDKAEDLRKYF